MIRLVVCLFISCCLHSAFAEPARYLVFFGVDGLVPAYYWQADRYGLKIPNLRALMKKGSYAKAVQGVLPTVTFPSDTTLVTGVNPARHGIIYNTPFDPTGENQGGWYWYSQDIKAKTLWDVAKESGLVTAALDWPVTAGAEIDYNIPEIWRAGNAEDVKLVRLLATPDLVRELEDHFGRIPTPYYSSDEERGKVAAYVVEKKQPNLALIYFSDLDTVQHEFGPFTKEAFEVLEMIDRMIGKVMEASREAGMYDQTVFAVASDHGFAKVDKRINPTALFKMLGLIQTNASGKVIEWKAAMHGPAVMLKDKSDTKTLQLIKRVLFALSESPEFGIGRIVEQDELKKLGGFPEASLLIEPREGYSIAGSLQGDFVTPVLSGGTHGLPPHFDSMQASFIVAGPGVKQGVVLEQSRMIDIAPTLARLLGLRLREAEGRPISEVLENKSE